MKLTVTISRSAYENVTYEVDVPEGVAPTTVEDELVRLANGPDGRPNNDQYRVVDHQLVADDESSWEVV